MNVERTQPAPASGAKEGRSERPDRRRGQPGVRQCVVTRERRPKDELVRLVLAPDGRVGIDLLERAPGRGVYVLADRASVRKALTGKGLGRTFRGKAAPMSTEAVDGLLDDAARRLDARLSELVSVARRAQVADVGMDAALAALDDEPPAPVVVYAHDVSDRSLRRVCEHATPTTRFVELATGKADLGSKLGRSDVGVVAIRPSALALRIVAEAVRRDGLGASLHSRTRAEGLTRDESESAGGRSN